MCVCTRPTRQLTAEWRKGGAAGRGGGGAHGVKRRDWNLVDGQQEIAFMQSGRLRRLPRRLGRRVCGVVVSESGGLTTCGEALDKEGLALLDVRVGEALGPFTRQAEP